MPTGVYVRKPFTEKHRNNMRETAKRIGTGKWMKDRKLPEEHRKNMSEARKGKKRPPFSEEWIKNMSEALKGRKLSEEHCKNISRAKKGKKISEKHKQGIKDNHSYYWLGKKRPEETCQKMRIATIEYIKRIAGAIWPRIGHNEKQILDKLENELNYKIIRQHECKGYFIDGYISELNLAIEVDERPKILEKDIEREKIIKNELNCEFLRIKDYD